MMKAWALQWVFAAMMEAMASLLLRDGRLERTALWVVRLSMVMLLLRPFLQQMQWLRDRGWI